MSHFDEKSGIVTCDTPWGKWWQTIEEVYIEVNVPEGTRGKEIACDIKPRKIKLVVKGKTVFEGDFPEVVQADDSLWTLEDKKKVQICLVKCSKDASKCWKELLVGQFEPNLITQDEMQKKLTLQRYQFENPGMDFSGAELTGNYQNGGPPLPGQ